MGIPLINGVWTWTGGTFREAIRSLAAQSVFMAGRVGPLTRYGVPASNRVSSADPRRAIGLAIPNLATAWPAGSRLRAGVALSFASPIRSRPTRRAGPPAPIAAWMRRRRRDGMGIHSR
jgi:hypothetical protein